MPSLLTDSLFQLENHINGNLVSCKKQNRAMFAKLLERKKTTKNKTKTWKQTVCPFLTHNPITQQHLRFLSTLCWKISPELSKNQSEILKPESLNKNQTKTTEQKKICENYSVRVQFVSRKKAFSKRKTTTKHPAKGETDSVLGTELSLWRYQFRATGFLCEPDVKNTSY